MYHQYLLEWIDEKHLSILKIVYLSYLLGTKIKMDLVSVTVIKNYVLLLKTNESQTCHK